MSPSYNQIPLNLFLRIKEKQIKIKIKKENQTNEMYVCGQSVSYVWYTIGCNPHFVVDFNGTLIQREKER